MGEKSVNKRVKWDLHLVKEYLKINTDLELLSLEYYTSTQALEFKCSCGDVFSNKWCAILSRKKTSCTSCKKKKRQEEYLSKIVEFVNKEGKCKLVSEEYVNSKTKLEFECNCGRRFRTSWDTFVQDNKRLCDVCSGHSNFGLVCIVCGSDHEVHRFKGSDLYCSRHYQQLLHFGEILQQTRSDRNLYNVDENENSVIIELYASDGDIKAYCIVDKCDWFGNLEKYKWTKESKSEKTQGYVVANVNGKNTKIHRLIMKAKDGEIIDHIDGDGLNNRRENLRRVNKYQSQMNRGLQSNNKSGYKGVHFHKTTQKWAATIGIHNKSINLGLFEKIEDAIEIRRNAEIKYFGEYNRGGL